MGFTQLSVTVRASCAHAQRTNAERAAICERVWCLLDLQSFRHMRHTSVDAPIKWPLPISTSVLRLPLSKMPSKQLDGMGKVQQYSIAEPATQRS